jgi:hypothetical protein
MTATLEAPPTRRTASEYHRHRDTGRVLCLRYDLDGDTHRVGLFDVSGEGECLVDEAFDSVESARREFAAQRAWLRRKGYTRARR